MVEPKYLTFDEYKDMGGDLNESLFNVLSYRAEKKVDLYTFNRLIDLEEIPNEVKMCIYDLIPLIQDDRSSILSESVGSYSVTRKGRTEINNDVTETIKSYLSSVVIDGVPVLYIGTDEN